MSTYHLERLMLPESIAVVGASPRQKSLGRALLNNLRDGKFAGAILRSASRARPDAHIVGVIIQPMIVRPKARELIAGIADDPTFGPVVVFGHGGAAVEVINDRSLALPPLDLKLARDLIGGTRVARLLQAYRDVPEAKVDDVALVLVKLAQLAADVPAVR